MKKELSKIYFIKLPYCFPVKLSKEESYSQGFMSPSMFYNSDDILYFDFEITEEDDIFIRGFIHSDEEEPLWAEFCKDAIKINEKPKREEVLILNGF